MMRMAMLAALASAVAGCGQGGTRETGEPPMPTPRPSPAGGEDAVANLIDGNAAESR